MKVGIIGCGGGIGRALRLLLENECRGIEIIEVTQEQVDNDEQILVIVGDPIIHHFEGERFVPKWSPSKKGKSGSNKSDRKRDRKNRWR